VKFYDFRRDPRFTGNEFLASSWAPSEIIARAFDGDAHLLDAEQQATLLKWTGRTVLPKKAPDLFALIVGRRGSKSRNAALIGTYLLSQNYADRLAPGEIADIIVLAPDREQSAVVFGYIKALVDRSPILRSEIVHETADSITLAHGTRISIATASFKTVRGRTLAGVIIDEAGYLPAEGSALPDEQLYAAVRPGLLTLNGRIIVISSPYLRQGLLYDLHTRFHGRDGDDSGLVIQATSLEMNPTLDAEKIAAETAADPENAASEYHGKFRSTSSSYLDEDLISRAVVRERRMLVFQGGYSYFAFVDASSGRSDGFAVAIAHSEPGGRVVLDALEAIQPPFDPTVAVEKCARLIAQFGLGRCTGDRFAVGYVSAAFAKHGIRYRESERSKSEIYRHALPLFTANRVELLDNHQLLHELRLLERRPQPGGAEKIDHPPRSFCHDDLANAAIGALLLAADGPVAGEYGTQSAITRSRVEYDPLTYDDDRERAVHSEDRRPAWARPILYLDE
jgi:hypothetical protein